MKFKKINKENRGIWDYNSACWDNSMGSDGNDWHNQLIAPETERLLNLKPGEKLLDIGCGNGIFARRMAKKGILVTAFDFSALNIEKARKYSTINIDYRVIDATNENDLSSLGKEIYNSAVANMVLMDIPDVESLFKYLKDILTDNGIFVYSIQHPCFSSDYVKNGEGNSIIINDYISHNTYKGLAIPTQPKEQYYFHRTISYYINLGFRNNFIIEEVIEPVFADREKGVYSKIPPVLIFKMRIKKSN